MAKAKKSTSFNKFVVITLLVLLPLFAFFVGRAYEKTKQPNKNSDVQQANFESENNYKKYFSISIPEGWNRQKGAGCGTATGIENFRIQKQLPSGNANVIICVFELANSTETGFTYKSFQVDYDSDDSSTQTYSVKIQDKVNGYNANVSEDTYDLAQLQNMAGLPGYSKNIILANDKYAYSIQMNINLNSREDNIHEAKKLILPEFDQILSSFSAVTQ